MKYQGKSKIDGTITEGTLMVEGIETWIATDTGRTAVWPDSVENIGERQKIVEESKEWQMTLIQFSITNIKEFCRLHACAECPLIGWCGAISEPDVPPCYWPDLVDTLAANEDEK